VTVALAPGKLAELAAEGALELLGSVTVFGQLGMLQETLAMAVESLVPNVTALAHVGISGQQRSAKLAIAVHVVALSEVRGIYPSTFPSEQRQIASVTASRVKLITAVVRPELLDFR
jgi:hypothetical protein